MVAIETATFAVSMQQQEVTTGVHGSSLYIDPSLLQREDFVRYLVAIILR